MNKLYLLSRDSKISQKKLLENFTTYNSLSKNSSLNLLEGYYLKSFFKIRLEGSLEEEPKKSCPLLSLLFTTSNLPFILKNTSSFYRLIENACFYQF